MNENYGKLENGVLTFAPSNLIIGDEQVFNATAEEYLSAGYLPIEYTPKPDNNEWQAVYTEVDSIIVQSWVYKGRVHDHSNIDILNEVSLKSLSGVPAVHILPSNAKDGDMCLYAPQNTFTLADSGKRIYFDWEEFRKPVSEDGWFDFSAACWNYDMETTTLEMGFSRGEIGCHFNMVRTFNPQLADGFEVSFNMGELVTGSSYYEKDGVQTFFNSIDELPPYIDIPEFDEIESGSSGNAYLFHTEYRLMKYQGGEWVEAVEVPTKTSELENDSGFITAEDIPESGGCDLYSESKKFVSRYNHQYFKNTALDTNKVDIAIFAGQSNSCGRAMLEDVTTANDVIVPVSVDKGFSFNNTDSTTPLQIVEPITANGSTGYGYIPSFINAYNKATGRKICACYKSFGGAMLNKWLPYVLDDTTGEETATVGAFYQTIVDAVSHAKTNLVTNGYEVGDVFLVWCQGEADAAYLGNENIYANAYEQSLSTDEEIKAYYKTRFLRLAEKLKEDTGLTTAFIVRIGHSQTDLTRNAKIIEAQNELCKENADCVMISSIFAGATQFIEENGTTRNLMKDASHYVPEGYLRAGLEAGVNAGIYNNSNKLVKPILLEYNNLINANTGEYERTVDAWLYDPERIDLNFIKGIVNEPVIPDEPIVPDEPEVDENVVFDFDFTTNTINDYALSGLFTIPNGSTPDTIEYDATKGMTLNGQLPNGLNLTTPIDATKPWTIEFTATIAEPTAIDGNRKALISGNSGKPSVYIGTSSPNLTNFGFVYGFSTNNANSNSLYVYNEEHTYKVVYDGVGIVTAYCDDTLKRTTEGTFVGEFGVILGNAVGQSTAWVWRNVESTNTYLKKFKFKYDEVTQ